MNSRKPRRDSDALLSKYGHKELLFKLLIIGDYGVGGSRLFSFLSSLGKVALARVRWCKLISLREFVLR